MLGESKIMVEKLSRTFQKSSLWVSLILHLLVFFLFFMSFNHQKNLLEKPALYVPAYLYHRNSSKAASRPQFLSKRNLPISPTGIEKSIDNHEVPLNNTNSAKNMPSETKATLKEHDPIHLLGDNKKTPKPLIKILGRALTASLIYPKSAVDFGIRGVAYVRFLLYPDGHITNVQLIQSSKTGVLDQAALDAVNAISPVKHVDPYLKEPKYIVFGFIFG